MENQILDNNLIVENERVDDIPLLIHQMIKMGYPDLIDKYTPKNWSRRKLSFGWTTVIWLAYILSEGDHRKVSVEGYIREMKHSFSQITKQDVSTLDFSDDRLTRLLKVLSKSSIWRSIDQEISKKSIEVYDLSCRTIRCDSTTVSGYHRVKDDGLIQFGHSKDNSSLPQIKIMTSSLDPMGMPLATDIISGNRSDDLLYIPIIDRINDFFDKKGLLFVGDCKMSSLLTRLHIARHQHFYLIPLAQIGDTAKYMEEWIKIGIEKNKNGECSNIYREYTKKGNILIAYGYEFNRKLKVTIGNQKTVLAERVLVVHSISHAKKQSNALEQRLVKAEKEIKSLTPLRGRGKRQIIEESQLLFSISKILKKYRVENLLDIKFQREVEQEYKYIGPGRGSKNRKRRLIERIRYQIHDIDRNSEEIEARKLKFGWKAFVTNEDQKNLTINDAILNYRNEYRVERIFDRLKNRLNIAPLFVKRDDQIEGMTYLLMLGAKVMSLIEFVVRRSLKADNTGLSNLHLENKVKKTDNPTAERILKAFSKITLTIIKSNVSEKNTLFITPLSNTQKEIIKRLGLGDDIYHQLLI